MASSKPICLARLGDADWRAWSRLERALIEGAKWKPDQVASLAAESLRVLRHLRDPLSNGPFEGRGLVVGYVQSGKTANYTAVAARAIDAGYRMVIVLSGIHDALRSQTQLRLERELVGIGPGEDPKDRGWTLLTDAAQDFQGAEADVLDRGGAFLVVAKKNVSILEKLNAWLADAGSRLEGIPTLVIDDEADQASINTRTNRAPDPTIDGEDEPVALRPGPKGPSPTNALIRGALSLLPKATYIGYTATPFANILIDPQATDRRVAVGGNRLSRGLTLEGLTVSYFLRTATMADTLLQMARWYGFRTGYEDLIRIWTTDGIAHWFTELALVEQSLRDSLRALARAGRRPDEMAIRLRAHSGLLLTARNKAGMADEVQESWSGEHPQTVMLPLQDGPRLAFNRTVTDRFLGGIGPGRATTGGWLMRDVPPEVICEFLRLYRTHDDVVAFRGDPLADWIMSRVAAGELTDWSVFLAGAQQGLEVTLGGMGTGLVTRSPTSSQGIGILIDPRHEGVDLPGGPDACCSGGDPPVAVGLPAWPPSNVPVGPGWARWRAPDPAADTSTSPRPAGRFPLERSRPGAA